MRYDLADDIATLQAEMKPVNLGGRPAKKFPNKGLKQQRVELDNLIDYLTNKAESFELSFGELYGKIGSRYYKTKENQPLMAETCDMIANNKNPLEEKVIDEAYSLHMKETLNIGEDKWDNLRALLLAVGVRITSRWKLQKHTSKLHANMEYFENGVWITLGHLLPQTLKAILELSDDFDLDNPDSLELEALIDVFYDGSGSHQQMQGEDIDIPTRNLILGKLYTYQALQFTKNK